MSAPPSARVLLSPVESAVIIVLAEYHVLTDLPGNLRTIFLGESRLLCAAVLLLGLMLIALVRRFIFWSRVSYSTIFTRDNSLHLQPGKYCSNPRIGSRVSEMDVVDC